MLQDTLVANTTAVVLLADEQTLILRALEHLLRRETDFQIVKASSGEEAVSLACRLRPQAAILSWEFHDASGLDVMMRIKAVNDAICVVFLSTLDDAAAAATALRMGASGYLLKDGSTRLVPLALQVCAAGGTVVDHGLLQHLCQDPLPLPPPGHTAEELTPRERSILELLTSGNSNQQIAERLHLSVLTVKKHVHHILHRLAVENRTQAALIGLQMGLGQPP